MTDRELDDLARRVMLDAARQEYGGLLEELPEHDFSPEFEKKMRKLVRRANHPVRYWVARAAACLLLVAVLGGCALLGLVPEARAVFVGWVREVCGTNFVYRYTGESGPLEENTAYFPMWLPDGYALEDVLELHGQTVVEYRKNGEEMLVLNYLTSPHDGQPVCVIPDGAEIIHTSVRGYPADLYVNDDKDAMDLMVWSEETGAVFILSGTLTEKELIRTAESVELVPVVYRPLWVPEGYELYTCGFQGGNGYSIYYNEARDILFFSAQKSTNTSMIRMDMEEGDREKQVVVRGKNADLYVNANEENDFLIWMDEERQMAFLLDAPLSEEDMIRVAESVRATPAPPQPHYPTWLPEGYHFSIEFSGGSSLELEYSKDTGETLEFRYWRGSGIRAEDLLAKLEKALAGLEASEAVLVDGRPAELYTDGEGICHLIWQGKDPDDTYWLWGPLDKAELLQVAESVVEQG